MLPDRCNLATAEGGTGEGGTGKRPLMAQMLSEVMSLGQQQGPGTRAAYTVSLP